MANEEHLNILKQGIEVWNQWRKEHPEIEPDCFKAHLRGAILSNANLRRANLSSAIVNQASLKNADLNGADLSHAYFVEANLDQANLCDANLTDANLSGASLLRANLNGANLSKANLSWVNLSEADLSESDISGCRIYAISAWNVRLKDTKQLGLIITHHYETSTITVDNLEVAQFIYLLLNNKKIRDVIDSISSKVVLILGRFTSERKEVLDALRDELRKQNYTPVLFDFEKPASRDFTETVSTLAHLARFIIADLTEPSSIPQELQAIIPDLEVPVQPLLLEAKREYSMFVDFRKYPWVLPIYLYKDQTNLIASLQNEIIEPAEKKMRELTIEKAMRLEKQ